MTEAHDEGTRTSPASAAPVAVASRDSSESRATLLSALAICSAALAMLALSWRKWGDPVIDFGTELYLAWRVYEGDVFFKDVTHTYSPLSAYINVGWFRLFGISYRSLIIGNAVVLTILALLLYRLLRGIASQAATTTGLLVFVLVFAFGQYVPIGNYNYLGPYAHELTHGLTLSLAAIAALVRYARTRTVGAIAACGLFLGLVFLTKYEVFFAALGAVGIGLLSLWCADRRWLGRHALVFVGVAPVPFLVCWAWLSTQMPVSLALRASLGPYPLLINGDLVSNVFFADIAGLSEPALMLKGLILWLSVCAIATFPILFIDRLKRPPGRLVSNAAAFLLPLLVLALMWPFLPWRQVLVPLPFLLLASLAWQLTGGRHAEGPLECRAALLALTAFALALLSRTPFFARVHHFGFVLSMPGTLLAIVLLIDTAPDWLQRTGYTGGLYRKAAMSLIVVFCAVHVALTAALSGQRVVSLGDGADAFMVDRRGAAVAKAVEVVRNRLKPEETLVVLPEGPIVNYLARRRSSVPYVIYTPFSLSKHGEGNILSELKAHPPDYILALPKEVRDLEEFGCVVFGSDCAEALGTFVNENYSPITVGVRKGRLVFTLFGAQPTKEQPPSVVEVP